MPEQVAGRLSVATLNTWGIHIRSSHLASRYTAIGTECEAGRADVVCFQEVLTYWHLRLLARRMPSFRHVSYRPSGVGPAGGLVTFSRRPVSGTNYQARIARGIAGPAVVCGDFNVDRDSSLFGDFMTETGLADAFEGTCPPTFRAEFLPPGNLPHCIDFILTASGVKAEAAGLLFADKVARPGGPGYVSDHVGLSASLLLAPA